MNRPTVVFCSADVCLECAHPFYFFMIFLSMVGELMLSSFTCTCKCDVVLGSLLRKG